MCKLNNALVCSLVVLTTLMIYNTNNVNNVIYPNALDAVLLERLWLYSLVRSIEWLTVSNALSRSRNIAPTTPPLSRLALMTSKEVACSFSRVVHSKSKLHSMVTDPLFV